MTRTDVVVVGAGPAGLAAASEAARAGLHVTVVDENLQAGGQIYRQIPPQFARTSALKRTTDFRRFGALFEEARLAGVTFRFGCTVWGQFERGVIEIVDEGGLDRIAAERIVLATGAHDRPTPLPGWTLPGVFTVGGAQALLKSQRLLPGRRMLLAGCGPLLLVVASQLADSGVEIVAVSEPVSSFSALTLLPSLAREWPLLRDGMRYRASLARRRVSWLSRTILTRIEGDDRVRAAVISRVDENWRPLAGTERRLDVDAVAIGYGLLPSIELPRICGADVQFDRAARAWRPVRTSRFESTVPGVFIVGDGAGIAGVVAAVEEGRVAGVTISEQLGRLAARVANERRAAHQARLRVLERFRATVERVYTLRPGLFELADSKTLACRCEEVTFGDLEEAAQDGADSPDMLKSFTRCGMGPCQGRMCATTTAEWLARRTDRELGAIGLAPPAPPSKPIVTLGGLAASTLGDDVH